MTNYYLKYLKYKKKYQQTKNSVDSTKIYSLNFESKNKNKFDLILQKGLGTDLVKDVGEKSFIKFKQFKQLDNFDKNSSLLLDIDNKYKVYFYMKGDNIIYRFVFDNIDTLVMNVKTLEEKIPEEYKTAFNRPRPIEIRYAQPINDFDPQPMEPAQNVWIKATDKMPEDIKLNQCLLAYASDMTLLDTCYRPHGLGWINEKFQVASLDHSMWFHAPFKTDEWMLYHQDSPFSGGSRGFNRGTFFTEDGKLIASATQEGLIRLHE